MNTVYIKMIYNTIGNNTYFSHSPHWLIESAGESTLAPPPAVDPATGEYMTGDALYEVARPFGVYTVANGRVIMAWSGSE
jgi:hypothetical protein